jgi:hypothetical protein
MLGRVAVEFAMVAVVVAVEVRLEVLVTVRETVYVPAVE